MPPQLTIGHAAQGIYFLDRNAMAEKFLLELATAFTVVMKYPQAGTEWDFTGYPIQNGITPGLAGNTYHRHQCIFVSCRSGICYRQFICFHVFIHCPCQKSQGIEQFHATIGKPDFIIFQNGNLENIIRQIC